MAYRIKISETPQQALRRLGAGQIDRACRALAATEPERSPVHETRKCLKRIRALLRLVRPGLHDGVFHAENARYRNIGRLLSPSRDAQILSATILNLEALAGPEDASALGILKTHFETARMQAGPLVHVEAMDRAREHLIAAKAAILDLQVKGRGFSPIEQGLRECYRRGLDLYAQAYRSETDETFHDWRKSVQLHWRHMALLSRAWPDMFSARIEAARQLSQLLGESQDLSVLIACLEKLKPGTLDRANGRRLIELSRLRQKSLRAAAEPRGAQIFAASPKALARSVTESWYAARAIEKLSNGDPSAAAAQTATGKTDEKASETLSTGAPVAKGAPVDNAAAGNKTAPVAKCAPDEKSATVSPRKRTRAPAKSPIPA